MAQTIDRAIDITGGSDGHTEALEQAALSMVSTLPRLFKAVKQQARNDHDFPDIGESQVWVLHMLAGGTHLTSDLARRFNVTTPTMTRIVDGLVEKDFVTRRQDPEDRRRIYLEVTELGAENAERSHQRFRAALAYYLSPLSGEQLADIVVAFRHLQSLLPDENVV